MVSKGLRAHYSLRGQGCSGIRKGTAMSSTTTETRTSVQAIEDALMRRVQVKQDDASAAALAEELLEEVRISSDKNRVGEACYMDVAAGKKAMQVWAWIPENPAFPKTLDVLWKVIIDGWLTNAIGQSLDEEIEFVRFVSSAKVSNTNTRELMLTRVKEKLDDPREELAFGKVIRFLKHINLDTAERDMTEVIGRMLGRYADINYLVFCAHILDTLKRNRNNVPFFFQDHTLLLNAADTANITASTVAVGHAAWLMQKDCFPSEASALKIVKSDHISLTWTCLIKMELDTLRSILRRKVDKIEKWRVDHPTSPKFWITLTVRNPELNGKEDTLTI